MIFNDHDAVLACAGKALHSYSRIHFSRNGDELSVDGEAVNASGAGSSLALRYLTPGTPIRTANGSGASLYVLRLPPPSEDHPDRAFLGSLDRSLLWMTATVAGLVLIATWTLTRRLVSPIEELRLGAREVARGDLSRRVSADGSDEIADLARSFNGMAAELEHQRELRRNLLHDVLHELRTPLTALRCRLDMIGDGLSRNPSQEMCAVDAEITHLTRLVDDLQEVALAEARELKLSMADIELNPIVVSAARAAGLDNDARLRLEAQPAVIVRGDAVRLRQVVLNLLSNAARYTPSDGGITVKLFTRDRDAIVEVHNTGSSLSAHDLEHVFDRFYRADPSRQRATGGTGLGLAIVKNLVEAHGGRIWVANETSGVMFTVVIPRTDPVHADL